MIKVPGLSLPLPTKLIVWVQASENYAWVHSLNSQPYLTTHTLKWFESRLPQFMRVNKSALVNPLYVSVFKRLSIKKARLVLSTGLELIVSRRRVIQVTTQLNNYFDRLN